VLPSSGVCPAGYLVKVAADTTAYDPTEPAYNAAVAVRCFVTVTQALKEGAKLAPARTPTPTPTPSPSDALFACRAKLTQVEGPSSDLLVLAVTALTTLSKNSFDSAARDTLSSAAASEAAINVSVQAVTCDPAAAEYLLLVKAGDAAEADGLSLAARGISGHDPGLTGQGLQKTLDAGAILHRANDLFHSVTGQ